MKIYLSQTGAYLSVKDIRYMGLNYETVEGGQSTVEKVEVKPETNWSHFKKACHQVRVSILGPKYRTVKAKTNDHKAWRLTVEYVNEERGDTTFKCWNDDKAVMVKTMEEIIAQTPTQWYLSGKVPVRVTVTEPSKP